MMKKLLLTFVILITAIISQAQVTLTTTSNANDWSPFLVSKSGDILTWTALPNVDYPGEIINLNDPTFDFSANVNNLPISINITSTDGFGGLSELDIYNPNSEVTELNVDDATALTYLNVRYNLLSDLNLSQNVALTSLVVRGNPDLTSTGTLDISNNGQLAYIEIDGTNIDNVDVSGKLFLNDVGLYSARLTTDVLDKIVNDLDSNGLSNGILQLSGNPENLSPTSLTAYNSLIGKGWTIDVPPPPPANSEVITLITTSSSSAWSPFQVTNSGTVLQWEAAANADFAGDIQNLNDPTFDFSANVNNLPILINITSTDGFAGLSQLDLYTPDGQITNLNVDNAQALTYLNVRYNLLTDLNLSQNIALTSLVVRGNPQLTSTGTLDISNNGQLSLIEIDATSIDNVDVSGKLFLDDVRFYSAQLTTVVLDKIVNDLDSNGLSNGNLLLSGNPENLSSASSVAYNSLIAKGWTIDVPAPPNANTEVITLTTTSNSSSWSPFLVTNSGTVLQWEAAANADFSGDMQNVNDPSFDFSSNINNLPIDVTITSTEGFDRVTALDLYTPNGQITNLNVDNAEALTYLNVRYNLLTDLNLSQNIALTSLIVRGNPQFNTSGTLDLSNKGQLTFIEIDGTRLNSVGVSNNPLLSDVRLNDAQLTSAVMDQIVNSLDATVLNVDPLVPKNLQLSGNPGSLSSASYVAYNSLIAKGWTIDVPAPTPDVGPSIQIVGNGVIIPNVPSTGNTPNLVDGTDFGQVEITTSSPQTFTIQNIGDAPLNLFGTPFISPPYQITVAPSLIIAPGGTTTMTVTYSPTLLGPGQDANIQIFSNSGGFNQFILNITGEGIPKSRGVIDVQGNGQSITNGDTTPSIDDDTQFGQVENGTSKTTTFTIVNNDLIDDLTVSSIDISFPPTVEFSISNISDGVGPIVLPYDVSPSSNITFDVIFSPLATGNYTAGVEISNSETNQNPFQFTIAGQGVENVISGDIMISQYYEGTTNSKWIEVVNRSNTTIPAGTYNLALFNHTIIGSSLIGVVPTATVPIPELAPGGLILFRNAGATLPSDTNIGVPIGDVITTAVCNFDGDDVILISSTTDDTCYANREDIVGTVPVSTWGKDISFVRGGNSDEVPELDFNVNNWISLSPSGDVDLATGVTNIMLGIQHTGKTIWNGSWNNFSPDKTRNAEIAGGYTAVNGNIAAYNLSINAGVALDFNSGTTNSVVVGGDLFINGSFTIGDQESLVMYKDNATITGAITKLESSAFRNDIRDITYWSSPITNATIESVFTGVDPNRIWEYDQIQTTSSDPNNDPDGTYWNVWQIASGLMGPGVGYAAEGPLVTGTHDISFTGRPNNGNISFDIFKQVDGNIDNDFNLIGNPYPSAIDIRIFLGANSGVIWPEIYLWTHTTPLTGGDFVASDYAVRNLSGGTGVFPGADPTENIGSSQGFFARALESGGGLLFFRNNQRMVDANDQFFKSQDNKSKGVVAAVNEMDRIWLNLTSNQDGFNQIMIAFTPLATDDGIEPGYDSKVFNSEKPLLLYSNINGEKYAIQSLGEFSEKESKVTLGFDTNVAPRVLSIGIDKVEGQFSDAPIYLVDNLLGMTHDLQQSDYNFDQTETGSFPDRFTLKFTKSNRGGLGNGNQKNKSMTVANKFESLKIDATDPVKMIKVYDVYGRLLVVKEPNQDSFEINIQNVKPGTVLLLESVLEDGTVLNRKSIKY